MNQITTRVLGAVIEGAALTHDYLQLFFQDGAILNIFNSYSILDVGLSDLAGSRIQDIGEKDDEVVFSLSPRGKLTVGLGDADYAGPECMEYIAHDKTTIIVW